MNTDPVSRTRASKTTNLAGAPRRAQSEALLGEARELVIVHNGREYRLRMTQNGKLILTA
jgi:hemin uptake protein HemP